MWPHLLGDIYPPERDEAKGWVRDYWRACATYRWHARDLFNPQEVEWLRRRFAQTGLREACLHLHRIGEPFGPSERLIGTEKAARWRARFDTSWRSITIVFHPHYPHTRQAAAAYLVGQGWAPGVVTRILRARPRLDGTRPTSPARWIAPTIRDLEAACALLEARYRVAPTPDVASRAAAICYAARTRPAALFELASLHRYLRWRQLDHLWRGRPRRPRYYCTEAARRVAELARRL